MGSNAKKKRKIERQSDYKKKSKITRLREIVSTPLGITILGGIIVAIVVLFFLEPIRNRFFPKDVSQEMQLSNEDLKIQTFDFVKSFREFINRRKIESITLNPNNNIKDEDERWDEHSNRIKQHSENTTYEYNQRFKIRAIILRDQLRIRLPKHYQSLVESEGLWETPTNFFGYNAIADDLEKMAISIK